MVKFLEHFVQNFIDLDSFLFRLLGANSNSLKEFQDGRERWKFLIYYE